MNRIKRLLNRKDIKLISQKDDTTIKSFNDLYQKSINEIENQIKEGLKKILEKAGFNDVYIIKNSIDNGWISIVEKHKPDKSLSTYCVSICGKLFAALDIRYKIIPDGDEIEVNSEITYF